ncbi:hypothetical protein [Natronorubrum texcoconense]|uniref:hypothetical protein n=1 Tax=Natronorubrum texcoconense TaxID=1095776 RepID=UPI000B7FE1F2|nr:hypothetical protein [Natronorubrum texcoconense]
MTESIPPDKEVVAKQLTGNISKINKIALRDGYELQLNGARNFGTGIADVQIINLLYTEQELPQLYNRSQSATAAMEEKDERWHEQYRGKFARMLQYRILIRDDASPVNADVTTPNGRFTGSEHNAGTEAT